MKTIVISTIISHWNKATERYLGGPILYETAHIETDGLVLGERHSCNVRPPLDLFVGLDSPQ